MHAISMHRATVVASLTLVLCGKALSFSFRLTCFPDGIPAAGINPSSAGKPQRINETTNQT
jgi:hypothetical protein